MQPVSGIVPGHRTAIRALRNRSGPERAGDAVGDAAGRGAGRAALGGEVQPVAGRGEGRPVISDEHWPVIRRNGATTSSGVMMQISMLPPSSATKRSPKAEPVMLSTPVSGAVPGLTRESS